MMLLIYFINVKNICEFSGLFYHTKRLCPICFFLSYIYVIKIKPINFMNYFLIRYPELKNEND